VATARSITEAVQSRHLAVENDWREVPVEGRRDQPRIFDTPLPSLLGRAILDVASWIQTRTYRGSDYSEEQLLGLKNRSVSVLLPARNVVATIGNLLDVVVPFRDSGLIDELVVIDAASGDGTPEVAIEHGVVVLQESDIMSAYGPAQGKGDAMWRGLAITSGEIVVYLDTDTENFAPSFVLGLLGPLLIDDGIQLLKGSFKRPLRMGDVVVTDGGGRVTELLARPFINLHVPELAGFVQPLAGEIAARRGLLESLVFPVGYGVEIAMLIDALGLVGLNALAQVDLGVRQNRHQDLSDLSAMAYAVLAVATARVAAAAAPEARVGTVMLPFSDGFDLKQVSLEERPAVASIRAGAEEAEGESSA
jgi:glucosyl-3-phosphoglycerate synthase